MLDIVDIVLFLALLGCSAFFAAAEVAFLSLSRVKMHALLEKGVPGATALERLRRNRRRVVIALIIGNTLANISLSALATSISISFFGDAGVGIAVGVLSFLLLTFGEIVPKSAATTYGDKMALAVAPALELIYAIALPLVVVFEFINHIIPGVYATATGIEHFSEEEVRSAIKLGAEHKSISHKEKELIENVLGIYDKPVTVAMTPKAGVVSIDAGLSIPDAHRRAIESNYSRFPVLSGGKVLGVVSVRILGWALQKRPYGKVSDVIRKSVEISQSKSVGEAFSTLQGLGRNIAIVTDEKGQYLGIVTLEDLLEEIVGEIKS